VNPRLPSLLKADSLLEEEVAAGAFPGGCFAVVKGDALVHLHAFGNLERGPGAEAVQPDTVYDLASLTKVVATTSLAMSLVDEGLDLEAPVASLLREFQAKPNVRILDLLAHSSGLPATLPLFRTLVGKQAFLEAIAALPFAYVPGTESVYSDLGFIVLGFLLEKAAEGDLEGLVRKRVLDPLGMAQTRFCPPADWSIAPTERDPWRGRLLRGEVHDENAFALGGIAGHAGLFGTAGNLARFARAILGGGLLEGRRIVSPETLARFLRRAGIPGSSRALGWDTPAPGSSAGTKLSADAIGHTGFTGNSLWIDRRLELGIILLTNRVYPTRENTRIFEVRRRISDEVASVSF
jgi:CubicO group peptidase (beta-lactamase class C family)